MSNFTVTLSPSGKQFSCAADQTILEAALKAGITLPYGCRNGACGSCKGGLASGEIDYGQYQDKALRTEERAAGKALFCCAKPKSDVNIEVRELAASGDIVIKTLPCRVEKVEKPADDVAVLYLKLPAQERLQFKAGQYIDILMKDGKRRSFSLANAPHDDEFLQLHIRKSPNGTFSTYVFEQMKERAIMRFEGPLGTFFLREDSDKPIIFLAGGTGFAPIKGVIEHAFFKNTQREMVLYWGVRSVSDIYMPDLPSQWQREHPNFTFIPVLSDPKPEDQWQGRTGFVHQAAADDFPDLAGYSVYACGGPLMIEAAQKAFFAKNLPEAEFYCDSFTPAIDPKAAAS
jgi:CDP-4-dehydro-6-deoxyglucose reductase, E3